ncbi:MAG: hypothetical protein ACFCUT_19270 [Kiloniellaceae bacterium]
MTEVGRTLPQTVIAVLCVALVLVGCAGPSQQTPSASDDWQAKVARYGYSNLVNGQHMVSRFCLRGGPFDANPEPSSGPYGFVRVDALDLQWRPERKVRVHDVATGESGWWRILFDIGEAETHAFFINPRLRMASCGERGLENLRGEFRPDNRPLVGNSLANAVYNIRPGTYVQDVSDQPDDVICGLAVSLRLGIWESAAGYSAYVTEAERRGFTPQSCIALVRDGDS